MMTSELWYAWNDEVSLHGAEQHRQATTNERFPISISCVRRGQSSAHLSGMAPTIIALFPPFKKNTTMLCSRQFME
jgi:hypothetical protein